MSVILDALRKLDREKSSRRNGAPNIAVEILRADFARPRKKIPLYFVAVPIATAVITYVVMTQFGFLLKSPPPAPVDSPAPSRKVLPAPSEISAVSESSFPATIHPPATTKQASPAPSESALSRSSPPGDASPSAPARSREPIRGDRGETVRAVPKIESDAEGKPSTVIPGEKKTSDNLISEETKVAPAKTMKLPEQTPGRSTKAPSSLRISGIIWSEEPSKRIAVINGMSLTEGSDIDGIKVVEILPARVRFFHNNLSFEIPLGVSYPYKATD